MVILVMFCCSVPDLPKAVLESLADVFRSLGSPVRLSLLLHLADGPARVVDLCTTLQASQPLVSHHLGILRSSKLVRAQRTGRSVVYTLDEDSLAPELLTALMRRHATDLVAEPGTT